MALSISHRPRCVLSAWSEGGPTRPYVNRPDSVKRQNYSEQQRACRLQGNEKWILSFPYKNTKSHISKDFLLFWSFKGGVCLFPKLWISSRGISCSCVGPFIYRNWQILGNVQMLVVAGLPDVFFMVGKGLTRCGWGVAGVYSPMNRKVGGPQMHSFIVAIMYWLGK